MLMFTRMPTRSKCMWGSRVGAWETSATVRVSLAWAKPGAGPTSARSASATAGTMDRFMSVSSSVHRDRAPGSRCKKRAAATYRVAEVYHGWAALVNAPAGWDPRARRRAPIRSGSGEGAVEGLGEVRDQVVGVLDADREADQVVLDADLEALLAGELVEAHDRGLLDQALHPAQRGRDERDRARVHHPGRRVEIARDLEGDHPTEAPHLLARDRVLGVGRETRVVHRRDARVAGEELGHRLRVRVLALHAQREGLEPAHEQVGREGIEHRAGDALQPPDRADQLGRSEHRAGEQVVVAAQVLGGGVHHHVDAPLERALVVRRREGGVDDGLHAMAPADSGESLEVEDAVVR